MTYLVLETHPAYAVVLDEAGRFLKAANRGYQVGDRVSHIVPLRTPQPIPWRRALAGAAGLAACVGLVFFGYVRPNFTPYGTLRIQINPDVEMTVSRTHRVLDLEGLNADGETLIAGYDYRHKSQTQAAQDLVERAIDLGFLSQGETVSISVHSQDPAWQQQEEQAVQAQLEEAYGQSIVIQLGEEAEDDEAGEVQVVIPVPPPTPSPTPAPTPTPTPAPRPTPPPAAEEADDDEDDGAPISPAPRPSAGTEEDDDTEDEDEDDDTDDTDDDSDDSDD